MRGHSGPTWLRSQPPTAGRGTASEPGVNTPGGAAGWGLGPAGLSSALPCFQRELPPPAPPAGITRSKSKHELKLLEKIPENAEATVVLVGMWASLGGRGVGGHACLGATLGLGTRGRGAARALSCP